MTIEALLEIHKGKIVATLPQVNGSCPGKLFFKTSSTTFDFNNPKNIDLRPGVVAKFELPQNQTILTIFLLFLLPLIIFIATYIVTNKIFFPNLGWLKFTLPWIFLLLYYPIFYLVKKSRKSFFRPTLLFIIEEKKFPSCDNNFCASCQYNKSSSGGAA